MRHAIKARFSNVIVVFLLKFKGTKEKRYLSALVYWNLRKKKYVFICVLQFFPIIKLNSLVTKKTKYILRVSLHFKQMTFSHLFRNTNLLL